MKKGLLVSLGLALFVFASTLLTFYNSQIKSFVLGTHTGPADSTWGTFHGNNQRTGLSPYDTAHVDGTLLWEFKADGGMEASPTIGEDDTIYFGGMDGYLYAVKKGGSLKWKTKIGTPAIKGYGGSKHLSSITSTPAIDKQGNIYVTSRDQYIFALNSDGEIKWKFQINLTPDHWGSPLVGPDGTIYVNGSPSGGGFYEVDETKYIKVNPPKGGLYALNPDGTLKWHYEVKDRMFNSPTMDKDGNIYIAVLTGVYKNDLIVFSPDGEVKWRVPLPTPVESSPSVADNGVVYLGSFSEKGDGAGLYAVTKDGIQWHHKVGGKEVLSTPAVASDGTIYHGSMVGSVFAINPDGTQKWEFETGGKTIESSTAIGADGTLYFGVNTDAAGKTNFFALNPDGTIKWEYATEMHTSIMASPAIGKDGTVYVGTFDGDLYAFGGPEKKNVVADLGQKLPKSISKQLPSNDIVPIAIGGGAVVLVVGALVFVNKKKALDKNKY